MTPFQYAVLDADAGETWICGSFFNPGPDISVLVVGRRRFNITSKKPISVKMLKSRGYKLYHRYDYTWMQNGKTKSDELSTVR